MTRRQRPPQYRALARIGIAKLAGAALFATVATCASAADQPEKMALDERVKQCAVCHGGDGTGAQSFPDYPRLAGQHADYLQKALRDYRSEARKNAIMGAQAKLLHRDELRPLAEYFARQKGPLVVVR